MTSETGIQTITINVLPGISKCKDSQTMQNVIIFFYKRHAENKAGKLVPNLFLSFKKASYEEFRKQVFSTLVSICFGSPRLEYKSKLYETSDC